MMQDKRRWRATVNVSGADIEHSLAAQRKIEQATNSHSGNQYDLAGPLPTRPQRPERPQRGAATLRPDRPDRPDRSQRPSLPNRGNGGPPSEPLPSTPHPATSPRPSQPPPQQPQHTLAPPPQTTARGPPSPNLNRALPNPSAPTYGRTLPTPPGGRGGGGFSKPPPTESLPMPPTTNGSNHNHNHNHFQGPPTDPLPAVRPRGPPTEALPTPPPNKTPPAPPTATTQLHHPTPVSGPPTHALPVPPSNPKVERRLTPPPPAVVPRGRSESLGGGGGGTPPPPRPNNPPPSSVLAGLQLAQPAAVQPPPSHSPPQPPPQQHQQQQQQPLSYQTGPLTGGGGFSRPKPPPQRHPKGPSMPQRTNFVASDDHHGVSAAASSNGEDASSTLRGKEFKERRATIQLSTKPGGLVPLFSGGATAGGAPIGGKEHQKQVKSQMKKMKDLEKKRAKEEKKKEKEEAKRKAKEEEEEAKRKKSLLAPPPTIPLPTPVPSTGGGGFSSPPTMGGAGLAAVGGGGGGGGGSPLMPATTTRGLGSPMGADPRRLNAPASPIGEDKKKFSMRITKKLIGGGGESSMEEGTVVNFTTADLFMWVREGNAGELRKALSYPPQGFNIAQQIETKSGDSVLHAAVSMASPSAEIVKLLLKHRAEVNCTNKSRLSPLFCAVMISAKPKIVSLLLEAGANVDVKDGDDNGLLHTFAMHSPQDSQLKSLEKTLSMLISKGVNINSVNSKGLTPLMLSCYSQNMFSLLLKKNPDLNVIAANGETVLHLIVKARNTALLGLVLTKNIDPRLGTPPVLDLESTIQIKGLIMEKIQELETGRVMVQRQASAALLKDALSSGGAVASLLNETAPVKKERKERTFSYLMDALQEANVAELKKFLAATGGSAAKLATEILNNDNQTALHIVCSRDEQNADPEVVKLFLKQKQIDPNAKDRRGWTPLHCCVFSNANPKIISQLISAGAETNATTVDGTRPIDYYVRKEPADWKAYTEAFDLLLQDSSINIKNLYSGETCLHSAVRARTHTTRVVQLLLLKGADPNIGCASGETPLHYAVKVARPDLVEILVKVPINTADPRKTSANGTPVDLAKQLPSCPEASKILSLLEERLSKLQSSESGNPREVMLKKLGDARDQRKALEERLTQLKESLPQLQEQLNAEQEREKQLRSELDRLQRRR